MRRQQITTSSIFVFFLLLAAILLLPQDNTINWHYKISSKLFSIKLADASAEEEDVNTSSEHNRDENEEFLVTGIIDGDTIILENGEKIRYIGMDTPEISPRLECFASEATKRNSELVLDKYVRLETDVSDRDRYGRLLRYVYVDDQFINQILLEEGYAHIFTLPPDSKYVDDFQKVEQEAREAKRGLWDECSGTPSARADCIIKGNITQDGRQLYHLPECDSYQKTVVNEAKGERWFCTETEAFTAGWAKANNCS